MKKPFSLYIYISASIFLSSCGSNHTIKPDVTEESFQKAVDIRTESFINADDYQGNRKIKNFTTAKKILKKNNFFGIKEELYCGCEFRDGAISPDAKCGLKPRKNLTRAYRIEFEHIVPFENQVGHTVAWREGIPECQGKKGRKCASKVFGYVEADLWNLWPAGGELNADRSNYSYSMVQGPRDQYGKCNFKLEDRKVEPRDEVKALVAFTYLYFEKTYTPVLKTHFISRKNEKLFQAWKKMPLTKEQCEWANGVAKVQGNKNIDLLEACQKL